MVPANEIGRIELCDGRQENVRGYPSGIDEPGRMIGLRVDLLFLGDLGVLAVDRFQSILEESLSPFRVDLQNPK
jgi:hypothetical protein